MNEIDNALREIEAKTRGEAYACGCIGPQNGEPLCPCLMRSVVVRNGRYFRVEDLGPVRPQTGEFADKMRALLEA